MRSCKFHMSSVTQIALIWLLIVDVASSLRDVRVKIPHAVRRGEKATLKCYYELEGDTLYSVKWYKGRREFYSFTPKDTPAMKVFQITGVRVERASSNESQLVLESVNLATTGKYSCEVSADAPSFHTLIAAGELEVVEVPGKDPVITGIRSRYRVGDIVRGNCTSRHSKPAANLTWTINGYETNPSHIRHHKPIKDTRELETAMSGIHFVVTPQHFSYGKLKIRCTAHIHDVYWKSTEKSIEEDRLKHNPANSINLVNTFSDDYFELDEDNLVDRSDTYLTNIKGDASSLNANKGPKLFCIPILPRLTIVTLLVYTVQQLLQLWQQLANYKTTKTIPKETTSVEQESQSEKCKVNNKSGHTKGQHLNEPSVADANATPPAPLSTQTLPTITERTMPIYKLTKRLKTATKQNNKKVLNKAKENCVLIKRKRQANQQLHLRYPAVATTMQSHLNKMATSVIQCCIWLLVPLVCQAT